MAALQGALERACTRVVSWFTTSRRGDASHAGRVRIGTIVHSLDGAYVIPWEKGTYLLGSNVEFRGFKPRVTKRGLRDMMRRGRRILPSLGRCEVVDAWAGLRPYSRRRMPFIGPARLKGLYLAAGYYRSGILIGAYAGKLLAKGIISGKMPIILKAFHPGKFGL